VVARGWYRIETGRCLSPLRSALEGKGRLYSFVEAVDSAGFAVERDGRPLAWGGDTMLCTRTTLFEIDDHADCAGRGFEATGFDTVETGSALGATLTFEALE